MMVSVSAGRRDRLLDVVPRRRQQLIEAGSVRVPTGLRHYLSSAIAKLGARNRTEAAATARERGWL